MSDNLLFVYGSFSEGMVHYGRISEFIENTQPSRTKGQIFRLEVGFPVFLKDGALPVEGHLVELKSWESLVQLMDEFHGYSEQNPDKSLFHRHSVEVELLADSSKHTAWTYSVNPKKLPKSAVLIEDGDWKRCLQQKPPLTWRLTERQVKYIKQLGASSGRDIVPIQLDLYRELMSEGIIVDKGRRLALTSLGHEVFRYL